MRPGDSYHDISDKDLVVVAGDKGLAEMLRRNKDAVGAHQKATEEAARASAKLSRRIAFGSWVIGLAALLVSGVQIWLRFCLN